MADEHSLNADLARILQKAGIDAEPQVCFTDNKGKLRTPDIVCFDVKGQQIGIEAKMGMGKQKRNANQVRAIAQADDLIEKSFCDAAIALIYPDGYQNEDDLRTGTIQPALEQTNPKLF